MFSSADRPQTTAPKRGCSATDGARSDRAARGRTGRRIKTENLLRQLLAARSGRRSEQITEEQLALFEAELKAQGVNVEDLSKGKDAGSGPDDKDPPASPGSSAEAGSRGRRALPGHLKRERIVHDLEE